MRGCIRTTVHDATMAFAGSAPPVDARTVATLRPGEDVDALFACTRKDRAISRSGQPYLTVELCPVAPHERLPRAVPYKAFA